jgi:membrane protein YdbS with pleckstrin-like domain
MTSNPLAELGIKLHENEEIKFQSKPSPRVAWFWLVSKTWHFILIIAFYLIFIGFNVSKKQLEQMTESTLQNTPVLHQYAPWLISHEFIIAITAVVLLLIILSLWFRNVAKAYSYVLTNQRCIIRYGLLGLNTRIVPYKQLSDVNMRCGFFERLFGLASVRIDCLSTVLGSNRGRYGNNTTCLEGLTQAQCNEAMDIISHHISQTS